MSLMRSAKEFFGLAPVDMEHEDAYYDDEPRYRSDGSAAYAPAPRREREYDDYGRYAEPAPAAPAPAPAPVTSRPKERTYTSRIVTVELASYTEATRVGEPFRDGDAVVFDLSRMEHGEARRVIDFAAGLCFVVRGQMKKLDAADRTLFAIVPEGASVSTLELERAAGIL